MLNINEPFRNQEIYIFSLFSIVQIWVLILNFFFCSFWLIFLPLDPDPDPGSQNLADPIALVLRYRHLNILTFEQEKRNKFILKGLYSV